MKSETATTGATTMNAPAKVQAAATRIAELGNNVTVSETRSTYADFSVWNVNFKSLERHAMLSTAGAIWFIETRSPRKSTKFDGGELSHIAGVEKINTYLDLEIVISVYTATSESGLVTYKETN
jgi:hypothetical protein